MKSVAYSSKFGGKVYVDFDLDNEVMGGVIVDTV